MAGAHVRAQIAADFITINIRQHDVQRDQRYRLFRRDGYRVLTANSVSEAFDLLASNPVQVIVSDQRMPDMSGTEFLGRVRDLYPDTIRMVLSGYTDVTTITEAINRGAIYRFLTKPWNDEELREHIHAAFRAFERRAAGEAGY